MEIGTIVKVSGPKPYVFLYILIDRVWLIILTQKSERFGLK